MVMTILGSWDFADELGDLKARRSCTGFDNEHVRRWCQSLETLRRFFGGKAMETDTKVIIRGGLRFSFRNSDWSMLPSTTDPKLKPATAQKVHRRRHEAILDASIRAPYIKIASMISRQMEYVQRSDLHSIELRLAEAILNMRHYVL